MKKQFSKQEKAEYYKGLRERWQKAKELADVDAIKAIISNHGLNISPWSFAFVQMQMQAQGLSGLPYLDMKTFNGWKENGFRVKKGEHSKADGLVWMDSFTKKEKNDVGETEEITVVLDHAVPKVYKLFHRSQVEAA